MICYCSDPLAPFDLLDYVNDCMFLSEQTPDENEIDGKLHFLALLLDSRAALRISFSK